MFRFDTISQSCEMLFARTAVDFVKRHAPAAMTVQYLIKSFAFPTAQIFCLLVECLKILFRFEKVIARTIVGSIR